MQTDDLFKLNLQALRVLVVVHRECSLTAAADRFGINQSSVSYTIDRLREVFGDPLFVRAGRGIEPTVRCTDIVAKVEEVLAELTALRRDEAFDPGTSQAAFTLSCNYHERVVLLPGIMQRIRAEAPGVRLSVIQANTSAGRQLREGACDLAISPEGADTVGILSEKLFDEAYVCFVAKGHPFAEKPPTLTQYLAAEHVVVRYHESWEPYHLSYLRGRGHSLKAALEVPSLGGLQTLMTGTDLVLTAPRMMRRVFEPALVCQPAPFKVNFAENMLWVERSASAQAHIWFRGLVREVATGISADAGHNA